MKISRRYFAFFGIALALAVSNKAFAKNTYRPKSRHKYIRGPRGGCYYINKNGNKTYVDRALCG